jgi:hypothetical protein
MQQELGQAVLAQSKSRRTEGPSVRGLIERRGLGVNGMSGVQDIRDGGEAPLPRADRYAAGRPVGFRTSLPEITIAFLALTLVAVLAAIVRKVRGPQAS